MAVSIRNFQTQDVDVVVGLIKESFDPNLWPFMVYCQHGIGEFLSVALRFPVFPATKLSYVHLGADGVDGFAEFNVEDDDSAVLSYLCVAPKSRGQGIATRLIAHFASENHSVGRLRLDVFSENTPAISLYTKVGFEREDSSVWITRSMPAPAGQVEIVGAAASLAMLRTYGFCELDLPAVGRLGRVGLFGKGVLNCRTAESFSDQTLLCALASSFPLAETAFAIVPEEVERYISVDHEVVNRSEGMTLDLTVARCGALQ